MKSEEKKVRQVEAEERNQAWRELHPEQQIRSLMGRRGNSTKQIKRILDADAERPTTLITAQFREFVLEHSS
jgi:hypothetical protein